MQIEGSVVLVTGANRGLGKAFATALLEAGAAKVYAGARDISTVTDTRFTPIQLDVTDPDSVVAAAETASDVTIVVNNAGISTGGSLLGALNLDGARRDIETNYFGTLQVSRAFAPVLAANGGGALVNMLSVLSFITFPHLGSYSASKSAAWSLTNALRVELQEQGTLVVGVHAGYIDTDLTSGLDAPKLTPEFVAEATVAGIRNGELEVLVDDLSRQVKGGLAGEVTVLYPALAS